MVCDCDGLLTGVPCRQLHDLTLTSNFGFNGKTCALLTRQQYDMKTFLISPPITSNPTEDQGWIQEIQMFKNILYEAFQR